MNRTFMVVLIGLIAFFSVGLATSTASAAPARAAVSSAATGTAVKVISDTVTSSVVTPIGTGNTRTDVLDGPVYPGQMTTTNTVTGGQEDSTLHLAVSGGTIDARSTHPVGATSYSAYLTGGSGAFYRFDGNLSIVVGTSVFGRLVRF